MGPEVTTPPLAEITQLFGRLVDLSFESLTNRWIIWNSLLHCNRLIGSFTFFEAPPTGPKSTRAVPNASLPRADACGSKCIMVRHPAKTAARRFWSVCA